MIESTVLKFGPIWAKVSLTKIRKKLTIINLEFCSEKWRISFVDPLFLILEL